MSEELREKEDSNEQETEDIEELEGSSGENVEESGPENESEDSAEDEDAEEDDEDEDDEDYEYEDDDDYEEIPPEEVKYSTTSEITLDEYKRMTRSVPWNVLMPAFLKCMVFVAAVSFALSFISSPLILPIIFIPGMLIVSLALWVLKGFLADRAYGKMMLKSNMDTTRTYEFCESYLLSRGANATTKIHYSMVKRMIETDTNIYLRIQGVRMVVILVKENCPDGLIAFLRERFPM